MAQFTSPFDAAGQLKSAGAVTATGVGQVAGSTRVVDLGDGRMDAVAMVDVSAITATGDQRYELQVQGSTTADFSAGVVCLASVPLGHPSQTGNTAATPAPAHVELAFTTEYAGVVYRFVRIRHVIAGTTPSVSYTAWLAKNVH